MSNMAPNGFSNTANKGIAPIIGKTLLRAIAGALLIESIILLYAAWANSNGKKKPLQ